jgi:hypothetical protein
MHCQSCAAPLDNPDLKGISEVYCKFCADEAGNLKSREEVAQGVAGWFMMWQKGIDMPTAMSRAEHYMKAMPAWAEETAATH